MSSDKMKQVTDTCYIKFDRGRRAAELEAAEVEHVEEITRMVTRHLKEKQHGA